MSALLLALSTLGCALIGSSVSPFFLAVIEPRDKYSAAPALVRMGVVMVIVGAALLGLAALIAKAAA